MLISIINQTRGEISDTELLNVIRAINLQIEYGFTPYWGMTALARLEGTLLEQPRANAASAVMRVQGPSRRDARKKVFFWFEMCDAVSSQTYEINGVPLQNFLLPAYFEPPGPRRPHQLPRHRPETLRHRPEQLRRLLQPRDPRTGDGRFRPDRKAKAGDQEPGRAGAGGAAAEVVRGWGKEGFGRAGGI